MILAFAITGLVYFWQFLRESCKIKVGKQGATMLGNHQEICQPACLIYQV
jgi:hypothetical protein